VQRVSSGWACWTSRWDPQHEVCGLHGAVE
jgi:hypothetical protein